MAMGSVIDLRPPTARDLWWRQIEAARFRRESFRRSMRRVSSRVILASLLAVGVSLVPLGLRDASTEATAGDATARPAMTAAPRRPIAAAHKTTKSAAKQNAPAAHEAQPGRTRANSVSRRLIPTPHIRRGSASSVKTTPTVRQKTAETTTPTVVKAVPVARASSTPKPTASAKPTATAKPAATPTATPRPTPIRALVGGVVDVVDGIL